METLTEVIIANQLIIIISCFAFGLICMIMVLRHRRDSHWWRAADLAWVALGGLGIVTALMAGVYADDSARLERQIDVSFATSRAFDRDAARFRLRYCGQDPVAEDLRLCEKIEFLSASTAINADLPLFADVSHASTPLRALRLFIGEPATAAARDAEDMDYAEKLARVESFDPVGFLAFDPLDPDTVMALKSVESAKPEVAADYRVLALTYSDLIQALQRLKADWDFLQSNSLFILFQVIALSLIAIAAPFRLGKSLVDLRRPT